MSNESEIKQVIIPQLGPNDTEVTLVEWFIQDGDEVQKGDIIFSLETAKAVTDIESEYNGIIVTLISVGEILNIGNIIAFVGKDKNEINIAKKNHLSSINTIFKTKINATKKAIQLANKLNIDISEIKQKGIIKTNDVELFFESKDKGSTINHNEEQIELNNYQKEVIKTISWQKENAIVGYIEKIIDIKLV